jgi:hypothetical protein
MEIEGGVKLNVEPAIVAIVAVEDPDTVIGPVRVINPPKVVVFEVFNVHGFETVIVDPPVLTRFPPFPVKVLEEDPRESAELTERVPPVLNKIPPEKVFVP